MAPPAAEVAEIDVERLGLTSGVAAVRLDVWNPNRGELEVTEILYELEIRGEGRDGEWIRLGEGYERRLIRLKGLAATRVTLSVPFGYGAAVSAVLTLLRRGEVTYRVKGKVLLTRWYGRVEVPFRQEGVQALPPRTPGAAHSTSKANDSHRVDR